MRLGPARIGSDRDCVWGLAWLGLAALGFYWAACGEAGGACRDCASALGAVPLFRAAGTRAPRSLELAYVRDSPINSFGRFSRCACSLQTDPRPLASLIPGSNPIQSTNTPIDQQDDNDDARRPLARADPLRAVGGRRPADAGPLALRRALPLARPQPGRARGIRDQLGGQQHDGGGEGGAAGEFGAAGRGRPGEVRKKKCACDGWALDARR